jgi:methyl-accepting chemotaxis protein
MLETSFRRSALALLGPLVLTAALVAAELLLWPRAVVLGALAAAIAGWLVLALWALRRAETLALHGRATAEQQALLSEFGHLVDREVVGAQGELDRSRGLIREAVTQLNGSFRSMEEQSRRQRTMITTLVDAEGDGSPGVRGFAEAAGVLTGDLARLLADDSRESVRTVQFIGEMAANLEDMFGIMGELKDIADQTARLSTKASSPGIPDLRSALLAFAFDLRQLTARSNSLNERVSVLIGSSKVIVGRIRARVEETAEREMNASIEAETRSDALVDQVHAINRSLVSGITLVSQCGSQIGDDVTHAVRSLQFEDITSQAMTAAGTHLHRLRAITRDAAGLQRLLASAAGPAGTQAQTIEEFSRDLRQKHQEWKKPAHKPVSQVSMTSGSVELF